VWSTVRFTFPSDRTYSPLVDWSLLKLRTLPSVALELASSTAVSRAVLKGDDHTEKASESSSSESSMVSRVRVEEEEEEKRRARAQVSHKNFC
jgi:hypothetical protein